MPRKKAKKKVAVRRKKSGAFTRIISFFLGGLAVLAVAFVITAPSNTPSRIASDNSLGTFSGVLPCADCSGLETTITFTLSSDENPNTYVETSNYQGKDVSYTTQGTWTYLTGTTTNPDATVLELTPEDNAQKSYYVVNDDNSITLLSQEKAPIDSPFNETLTKQ